MIPHLETDRSANRQELVFSKELGTAPGPGLGQFQEAGSQEAQSCAGEECPPQAAEATLQGPSRHLSPLPQPLLCKAPAQAPPGLLPAWLWALWGSAYFLKKLPQEAESFPHFLCSQN